jgi:hypothetical protein
MKNWMLASIATLSFVTGMTGVAIAQDVPPPAPAAPPAGADPNAGQPTGAVPADPGMAPAPADVPSDPAAPVGSSANPVTVGGNMTPPPGEAKEYPKCSKTVQDSCINPGEAKRKPGKGR